MITTASCPDKPRILNSIWAMAAGYFAAYIPYTMLTKGLSKGLLTASGKPANGPVLLPISMYCSVAALLVFWISVGWWREAAQDSPWHIGGWPIPRPRPGTWLSGLCVAGISATTTLAFTFDGVSIVMALLLMRGGVLLLAPLLDLLLGRRVARASWLGLVLTAAALTTSLLGARELQIPIACRWVLATYLACYGLRFWLMGRLAKSSDAHRNRRFFVEEQLVGNGLLLLGLAGTAALGHGSLASDLRQGFTGLWGDGRQVAALVAMGLCSSATGMFGSLVLLDRRENTFCVPINRASSLLAGLCASWAMAWLFASAAPRGGELAAAGLLVAALAIAAWPRAHPTAP